MRTHDTTCRGAALALPTGPADLVRFVHSFLNKHSLRAFFSSNFVKFEKLANGKCNNELSYAKKATNKGSESMRGACERSQTSGGNERLPTADVDVVRRVQSSPSGGCSIAASAAD